jgi:chromatin segregation and condensation protein Rec8/ScpA/Scc1 (kleisin family)
MSEHHKVNAKTLLSKIENRTQAIFIFLAMLDLIQQEMISIVIESDKMNDFVLVSVIPESDDQTIE